MARAQEDHGEQAPSPRRAGARSLDRDIWAMAWPAMLSYLLIHVIDMIDVILIGRLGRTSVAAYGYSAQYLHLVNTVIQAVGIGCVALLSRSVGAGEPGRARRALAGALVVAVCIACGATCVVHAAAAPLLGVLGAEDAVVAEAVPYFLLVVTSTIPYAIAFIQESALRAHRMTRLPMMIAGVITLVKAGLNVVLIYGALGLPALGLVGAGLATLLAHSVGCLTYLWSCRVVSRTGFAVTFSLSDLRRAGGSAREVLRVSIPAIGERLVMSSALLTYFAILSGFGTAAVAAYAIGVRLLSFSWVPGLGFSAAAATFVGQALGAGDPEGARRAATRAVRLAVLFMTGLGLACLFLRAPLARVFTDDAAVIAHLLPFLLMLAVALPFMGTHFTLGGALRGAGDTLTPLIAAGIGNWVFRVPLAWVFAALLHLDLVWVWAALVADHVARMIWNVTAFRLGKWARRTGAALGAET